MRVGATGVGRRAVSMRTIALLVIVVVVLVGLAWWGIADRAASMVALTRETNEMAVPTVSTVSPKRGAPQDELVLPGSTQAYMDAPIYARTSGYLARRYVELGTRVRANQLLAEIDAPELQQQLEQARADLATSEANTRLAVTLADRYRELVKTESVSQQDMDNAVGALDARKTAVESARHNVQRLEQLQAYTRINAPFAGVITARNTDVGALIDSGAGGGSARELFHIASTDRLRVFVNVPQSSSRVAKPGNTAELTLAEFPGRRFACTLVRTAQSLDVASRTLLAELDVPNPTGELLAGAYAEVHIKLPSATSKFLLPVNALIFGAEGLRIAVVRQNSRVEIVPIALGRDFGTEAEVVSGLIGDERVIINPPDSIAKDQIVRVATAARAPGPGETR